jgi:Metallo-beta-lactamase superfamily
MDRFIALPVGQGDSFFLQRGSSTVLVDGGRSNNGFAALFKNTLNTKGVNVLVCTHNDADHTNGLIGFLESGLSADEIWLPGSWLQVLPEILGDPRDLERKLIERSCKATSKSEKNQLTLETLVSDELLGALAETANGDVDQRIKESPALNWPDSVRQTFELKHDHSYETPLRALSPWPHKFWGLHSRNTNLFFEAIQAADRIRKLATLAYHRNIKVRWFEYNPNSPSGGNSWLKPLNSQELSKPPQNKNEILIQLALTVANRRSLVFLSPKQIPDHTLVTAPHHGSDANTAAYENVGNNGTFTWVRSDGNFRTRPCPSYLALIGKKFCTLCRGSASPKQAVEIQGLQSEMWRRSSSTGCCSCV